MKIAIVGAGPRGLLILNNLVNEFPVSNYASLLVYLIDRYPVGGRVWQVKQNHILKMDTPCQQITMFNHHVQEGPNLYQWIKNTGSTFIQQYTFPHRQLILQMLKKLGPNDFAPRCVFGFYLRWFFQQNLKQMPKGMHIKLLSHYLFDLSAHSQGYQLTLEDGEHYQADRVVLNLGQKVNTPSPQDFKFLLYARDHHLDYFPVGYVEEHDFSSIDPHEDVIVRGLGLNFADCVNVLTRGRGGRYHYGTDHITYQASGKEPRLIAGSGSGLPYYCKTINQIPNGHHYQPHFIRPSFVKRFLKSGRISYEQFIHLLKLDLDLVYYTHLIRERNSREEAQTFKKRFLATDNHQALLASYNFAKKDQFSLYRALHPIDLHQIHSLADYRKALLTWMSRDIADAKQGNAVSPLSATFEVFRNGRNEIRAIVQYGYFTANDYVKKFLPFFNKMNSFLSMGAPVIDMEKLKVLLRSGDLIIIPGTMQVGAHDGHFVVQSKELPSIKYQAAAMIESRNPVPKISRMIDPLTSNLVQEGILSRPSLRLTNHHLVHLDTTQINPDTDQMINKNGQVEKNLFTWGLSTEGVHWCTPTAPHTSGHDANLLAGEKITEELLNLPVKKIQLLQ